MNPVGRYAPETEVEKIRAALRSHPGITVEMRCFNRREVDSIRALLTPRENQRVVFQWWEWPSTDSP